MGSTIRSVEVERVEQSLWGVFAEIQRSTCASTPMSKYEKYASSYASWNWPQAVVLVRITDDAGNSGIGWAEDGVGAASNIVQRHFLRLLLGLTRHRSNFYGTKCLGVNPLRAQGSRDRSS